MTPVVLWDAHQTHPIMIANGAAKESVGYVDPPGHSD